MIQQSWQWAVGSGQWAVGSWQPGSLLKRNRDFVGNDAAWQIESLTGDKIVLKNDTLKQANRITWSHASNDHWLTEIHNPKGIIKYDLERVPWLEEVVNRFIRKAGR